MTSFAIIAAAAALSFVQTNDLCIAKVKVSPKGRTCLTAAYRGKASAPGRYAILGPDGKTFGWTELDEGGLWHNTTELFYETTTIPEELTHGKNVIELTLKADRLPTRKLVSLWTHANPLFDPPASERDEAKVEKLEFPRFKPIPKDVGIKAQAKIYEMCDELADDVCRRQMWGKDWKERCARGEWHKDLLGAFDVPWQGKDGVMDVEKTKNSIPGHFDHLNNFGPMILGAVLAYAYTTPEMKRCGDRETLERVAVFLDFCRRAQGGSGSYWSAWVRGCWMGGPKRGPTSGTPLDGAGLRGVGHALAMTAKAMEREGLLDELMDDDCDDSTPMVPRRKAYLDLMDGLIGHFSFKGGHAPNQESYQLDALRFCIKARRLVGGPSPNEPDKKEYVARLRRDTGAVGPGEWSYVSPNGIPLEWGGYSVEYGRGQDGMYYRLWQSYPKLGFLRERAKIGGDSFTHFVYPVRRGDGKIAPDVCSFLNFRHRNMVGGDGYGAVPSQVLDIGNPAHIRLKQIEWMDLDAEQVSRWNRPLGGNWYWSAAYGFIDGAKGTVRMLQRMSDPADPLCANVKLPMESGMPDFFWGDPVSQNVAFKDGENRVMMSFNQWNRGEKPHKDHVSYIYVRRPECIQYLRVRHDDTGSTAEAEKPDGVRSIEIGPWLVVQNGNTRETTSFPLPKHFTGGVNVLGGAKRANDYSLKLKPGETVVLRRGAQAKAKTPPRRK